MKIFDNHLILRHERIDSQMHKFTKKALKKADGKNVVMTLNFDDKKIVGNADLIYDENIGIIANLKVENPKLLGKFYPAVCGILKSFSEKDGIKIIDNFEMLSIGISDKPNIDSKIKPININKE